MILHQEISHILKNEVLFWRLYYPMHYNDVIMSAMASQITSLTIIYLTVYSRHRSKKTSKLHVTGFCEANSPVTGEFPAQRASNAKNVSIWWRHHGTRHTNGILMLCFIMIMLCYRCVLSIFFGATSFAYRDYHALISAVPSLCRNNERDGVSNHNLHDCLLNRLFRRRSKKKSKLRITGLCAGNSPVIGEFPAQMASNAGNVSIWWRHHGKRNCHAKYE